MEERQMSEMKNKGVAGRRVFLKLVGLVAAGGVIGVVAGKDGAEAGAPTGTGADDNKSLYRETDQVMKYYELARF